LPQCRFHGERRGFIAFVRQGALSSSFEPVSALAGIAAVLFDGKGSKTVHEKRFRHLFVQLFFPTSTGLFQRELINFVDKNRALLYYF
jgi:hypothetical protein